jgi:hypothetical protein
MQSKNFNIRQKEIEQRHNLMHGYVRLANRLGGWLHWDNGEPSKHLRSAVDGTKTFDKNVPLIGVKIFEFTHESSPQKFPG